MCAERRNSMNFSKGFDGFWASSIWCKPRKSQGGGFLATSDLFLWFLTTLDMFAEKSIASSKQLLSWAFDRSFWSKAGTCRPQQFANQGHGRFNRRSLRSRGGTPSPQRLRIFILQKQVYGFFGGNNMDGQMYGEGRVVWNVDLWRSVNDMDGHWTNMAMGR